MLSNKRTQSTELLIKDLGDKILQRIDSLILLQESRSNTFYEEDY